MVIITDKFKPVTRQMDKPFRLSVADVFKGMGSGFSAVGRIASGSVQAGDKLQVMPSGDIPTVKSRFIGISSLLTFLRDFHLPKIAHFG